MSYKMIIEVNGDEYSYELKEGVVGSDLKWKKNSNFIEEDEVEKIVANAKELKISNYFDGKLLSSREVKK